MECNPTDKNHHESEPKVIGYDLCEGCIGNNTTIYTIRKGDKLVAIAHTKASAKKMLKELHLQSLPSPCETKDTKGGE